MSRLGSSVHIDAPPDRVYAIVTDLAGAPDRIGAIESLEVLTDQPFGVGTRFRETRTMFGRRATEEMEVTAVDPGRSYTTEAESCGCRYTCVVSIEPDGGGATLSMSMRAKPLRLAAKVMCAVMAPLMGGVARKAFARDLQDIKAAAERG